MGGTDSHTTNRLETVEEVCWQTNQHSISVVQSAEYQRDDDGTCRIAATRARWCSYVNYYYVNYYSIVVIRESGLTIIVLELELELFRPATHVSVRLNVSYR